MIGELFYGKKFGFMQERRDVDGYMKAIDTLLFAFTLAGIVPSYLTMPFVLLTILIWPSMRGALGAVKKIEISSKTSVSQRHREIQEPADNGRDILKKLLQIVAAKGEKVNFTSDHVVVESYNAL